MYTEKVEIPKEVALQLCAAISGPKVDFCWDAVYGLHRGYNLVNAHDGSRAQKDS